MSVALSINRRIVRNSLILYLRMLISVAVGLYTSRVVLLTLGVEDYGIYGLVGGIVSMFGFLNTSLAGATSRFITYELGKGDINKLKETFNAAFQSHLVIAFIIILCAETIGLWFVNHRLYIPQNRLFAAQCIYQFSIVSAVISITQIPYTAVVLAHERMNVYAWLELLSAVLKLIIVWILQLTDCDKLVLYGILSLAAIFLLRLIYRFYCLYYFSESHLIFTWQPQIFRQLFSFTGWNLYADASVTVRQQGINILINRFFNVAINASFGLASMIQGFFWLLGYNVLEAFRPQIIKQFAVANYFSMQQLMDRALKFVFVLLSLFSIPAIVEMPLLLQLWLGDVPPYAVSFCRILLIDNIIGLVNYIINLGVYAQGEIRVLCVVSGTLKFLCIPVIFILFSYSFSPSWAFLCNLVCLCFIVIADLFILKFHVPQLKFIPFLLTLFKSCLILVFCTLSYLILRHLFPEHVFAKFLAAAVFVFILLISSYFFLLSQSEQKSLRSTTISKL